MKKLYMMAFGILALAITPTIVFAAASTLDDNGRTITNGTRPDLTFDTSPNVTLNVFSTNLGYAIVGTNTLTSVDNGMEYFAHHNATGYAQRQKVSTTLPTLDAIGLAGIPTDDADKPWAWMGGGGS